MASADNLATRLKIEFRENLTPKSKSKYDLLKLKPVKLDHETKVFLKDFYAQFTKLFTFSNKPKLTSKITSANVTLKRLLDFNKEFGTVNSQFELQIKSMNHFESFDLEIDGNIIEIYFLAHCHTKLKAVMIFAICQFCNMYPSTLYDNLKIFACLDNLTRDCTSDRNLDQILQRSGAFTVSGVTYPSEKVIILTKSQEILKLMFHELVHFVGLDECFARTPLQTTWSIENPILNPREAYTEFLAVILHAAFKAKTFDEFIDILELEIAHSVFLSHNLLKFYDTNPDDFFERKSPKLTCPIQIWEYVILRTNLLLNLNSITKCVDSKFNCKSSDGILNLMLDYRRILEFDFQLDFVEDLSYLLLDWSADHFYK
jgi:hypothetical protein